MRLNSSSLAIAVALSTLWTGVAQARPAQIALDLLSKNYDPAISAQADPAENLDDACTKSFVRITGKDPLKLTPRPVTVDDYVPMNGQDPASLKSVLLLPPTGGENALDRNYALALCQAGFRVVLVKSWADDTLAELDLEMHDRGSIRMVTAVRHVVAWINPQRPKQLGVLGTSVGGISAALVLGYEPRLSAGFMIVAGAGMSRIIAHSTEATLSRLRDARMKEFGFKTADEYEAALARQLRIDPMDFVGYTGQKPVSIVIADADKTVLTETQLALWEAYGRPTVLHYDANHMWTIIRMATFQRHRVVNFFNGALE